MKEAPTLKLDAPATILHPKDYARAMESPGLGSVLLLGDDALSELHPREVHRVIRPPVCRLILALRLTSFADSILWARETGAEPVEIEDLEARVREEAAVPLRADLPRAAWVPSVLRYDAITERILAHLPNLGDLTPSGLGSVLRKEEERLRKACRDRFARTPMELIWRFKEAYVRQQRADGESYQVIAFALGYSNDSNLIRALHDHGVDLRSLRPEILRRRREGKDRKGVGK